MGASAREIAFCLSFLNKIRKRLPLMSEAFSKSAERNKIMVSLRDDERLDYLLAEDMKIVQSPTVFAFH